MSVEMPNIRAVKAGKDRNVVVTWKGGGESVVDLAQQLGAYKIFAPLCGSDELFSSVMVGEWGWNIGWSDEMEISSDTLWRLALEQGAAWLRNWRGGHGLSQAAAAQALGVSLRMWRYYEAGSHLLPKTVRLAAAGLDAQAQAA